MARNKIQDLRDHLFETIERLKDEEKPLDLDRARAIAEVAKVVVESAKVEVAFVKATGAVKSTNFLPVDGEAEVARPRLSVASSATKRSS